MCVFSCLLLTCQTFFRSGFNVQFAITVLTGNVCVHLCMTALPGGTPEEIVEDDS